MVVRLCCRRHYGCRRCWRYCCLAASWLRGLPRVCAAGLRARMLLDVPTSLRWCRPHRRLYRPAGASLPRLCRTSLNRKCAPTDARQIQQLADVGGDAPGLTSGSLASLTAVLADADLADHRSDCPG